MQWFLSSLNGDVSRLLMMISPPLLSSIKEAELSHSEPAGSEPLFSGVSVQLSCSVVSDSLWPHGPQVPGLPVHHQLLEITQTHVHWVGDAIQPSHPLSSPSPPAFNLSQHQGLFQWSQFFASGGQSTGASASASVLPMNTQDYFPLGLTGWISLQSRKISRVFSNTTVRKHQFFSAQLSL